jgi:sulfur-carrier protein
MRITIKLFATIREGRGDNEFYETRSEATVGEVVAQLGIPGDKPLIIFVNGRHANADTRLNERDRLSLFPPVGGG